jgi:hypothetical protein
LNRTLRSPGPGASCVSLPLASGAPPGPSSRPGRPVSPALSSAHDRPRIQYPHRLRCTTGRSPSASFLSQASCRPSGRQAERSSPFFFMALLIRSKHIHLMSRSSFSQFQVSQRGSRSPDEAKRTPSGGSSLRCVTPWPGGLIRYPFLPPSRPKSSLSPPVAMPQGGHPPHYSITSSARSRNDSGIVRPSALAVVKLITRSNLVGCSIGMSPSFAPRRILST